MFQSLTRDSNHSNDPRVALREWLASFNPSRGIAIIQTTNVELILRSAMSFNPSRGIAIIQTDIIPVISL